MKVPIDPNRGFWRRKQEAARVAITQNDIYAIDDQLTAAVRAQNAKLQNPFKEKPRMSTIGEMLKSAKAEFAAARQEAADAVAQAHDAAQLGISKINEVKQQTADFRAELAEITNGGPA